MPHKSGSASAEQCSLCIRDSVIDPEGYRAYIDTSGKEFRSGVVHEQGALRLDTSLRGRAHMSVGEMSAQGDPSVASRLAIFAYWSSLCVLCVLRPAFGRCARAHRRDFGIPVEIPHDLDQLAGAESERYPSSR